MYEWKQSHPERQREMVKRFRGRFGIVLPAVFSILGILAMIAFALTGMGMQSLGQASSFSQDDQALYAADAGLAVALAQHQSAGELPGSEVTGKVKSTEATWTVKIVRNDTTEDVTVPGGAVIPPDTAYLVSEGQGRQKRAIRRTAALVQTGVGTVEVGTLALDKMRAEGSVLAAYDSKLEAPGYSGGGVDPDALLPSETVLATNADSGTPIELIDSEVKGTILVGPGGDPKSLISATGTTTTQRQGSLTEAIDVPEIEVPDLPATKDGEEIDEAALMSAQYYKPTTASEHISFSRNANGVLTIQNQCFECIIQTNGDFTASEVGGYRISGNLRTQTVTSNSGYTADFSNGFKIDGGYYHGLEIRPDGTISVDAPGNGSSGLWSAGTSYRQTYTAPQWLLDSTIADPAEDLDNPDEIGSGRFDEIKVTSGISDLISGSTIVARDLTIEGGQLQLPEGADDVTIYVTGKLRVTGENAILNKDRNAPALKVFYVGDQDVQVSGGAEAFLTLIAPDANVTLEGHGSSFYGALMGKEVNLKNANVFFDVSTEGVGTGNDGNTLKVLSRHRL